MWVDIEDLEGVVKKVNAAIIDVAGNAYDAAGVLLGSVIGGSSGSPQQSAPNMTSYGIDAVTSGGAENLPGTWAMSGGNPPTTQTINSSSGGNDAIQRIMQAFGVDAVTAQIYLEEAPGDTNLQKSLALIGIEPWATRYAVGESSGGSGGGGGGSISPLEATRNRQALALFDPNYADGALIPLPDGTSRINGTEIIIDARARGEFKPVSNAPGYLVDPVTGSVINTNGDVLDMRQLDETIRSNKVNEGLRAQELGLSAELGRGRLDLDRVVDIGRLNLDAAATENEQTLRNILETNGLNLESFLGTGNLNIGATNAETNRLNALTGRTSSAGQLATANQELADARTMAVIDLMANPNDFVEREYATRALITPPGYTGPAFRDDPRINSIIDELMRTPDVEGLLPTYNAPTFAPVNLPNASLPRVSAPPPQPQTQITQQAASAPIENRPATQAESSAHFRNNTDVPDWALAPLGFAYGTDYQTGNSTGTKLREFITGDPQMDGMPNPEKIEVNNPGPRTTVSVTPLRDMLQSRIPRQRNDVQLDPMENPGGQYPAMGNMNPAVTARFQSMREAISPVIQRIMESRRQIPANYPQTPVATNPQMPALKELLQSRGIDLPMFAEGTNKPKGGKKTKGKTPRGGGFKINSDVKLDTTQIDDQRMQPEDPSRMFDYINGGPEPEWINKILSALSLRRFAYGTDYGSDYNGPVSSTGQPLGQLTSYDNNAIRNMPNVQYALGNMDRSGYNTLNTGKVSGAFGTKLPDVGGLNYGQLLDLQQDPDSWGTLSSLYRSANRNLEGILARVLARAPIGNALQSRSMIRTA